MYITYFIIGLTCLVSFIAFSNHKLMNEMFFYPYRMWQNNEWHRLLSGGFIHANLGHLFFNMFALFSFGTYVEDVFAQVGISPISYAIMYLAAIVLSDILNLFTKKNNPEYRSLGASGGVSAVIFASILFNPFGTILIFFFPMPAIVFGVLYLVYCVYMAKRGGDNIGHIAHFTGSLIGFFFPVILEPRLLIRFIDMLKQLI